MMDAVTLAEQVIEHLATARTQAQGVGVYPWIAVGHELITPWQLVAMTDEELRRPEWNTADVGWVTSLLWSMRGYAQPSYAAGYPTFLTGCFTPEKVNPAIVLFWPPRKIGKPIEFVQWIGADERVIDVLEWLVTQPIEPYEGARRVLYTWTEWGLHGKQSTPVQSIPAWED